VLFIVKRLRYTRRPDPVSTGVGNESFSNSEQAFSLAPLNSAPFFLRKSYVKNLMLTNTYFSTAGVPIALTVAGSDSGGGAGIQADLKTFAALGVYGCSAITSLTAQNTLGVQDVLPIAPNFIRAQIQSVLDDIQVGAIKTGMLATADIIQMVIDSVASYPKIPLVVDPVMVSTSGDRLLAEDAIQILIERLIPCASLLTPNLTEAAVLLNVPIAKNVTEMQAQAEALLLMGAQAVLVKGGHGDGENVTDVFLSSDGFELFSLPRIATKNTHGTGCTLAAAIAAGLAKKMCLLDAVAQAKDYLHHALLHSDQLKIGKGSGPVHHFYQFY
jgi:hydroxymethylpyrimidine/phosphomethylpyrimidine kinase